MSYIYETHLHTTAASACARSAGSEYISFYKNLGFDGIFVTDHFFNGNCCVPQNLPWEERVEIFCSGYEDAKAEGSRQGLKVFFAWECRFDGDEFLVYGLDKNWLKHHPDMMTWDHITHYQKIKTADSSCRHTLSGSGIICPKCMYTPFSVTPLKLQTAAIRMSRTAWHTAMQRSTRSP